MVEDAAGDDLRLLEVRYCPESEHPSGPECGRGDRGGMAGIRRGARRTSACGPRIINCSLRHYEPAVSVRLAERSVAQPRARRGRRSTWPAASATGRPACTAPPSTSRWRADSASRCTPARPRGRTRWPRPSRRCHAIRIGHGTRLAENPALQDYVRDRRILVETNLTSNVQTRAVARLADHPVRGYFDAGLNVTLCTDSWLMSGTTLSHEYWLAHTELGFTREDLDRMILNAFASSFLPWPDRQALLTEVSAELEGTR